MVAIKVEGSVQVDAYIDVKERKKKTKDTNVNMKL